MGMHEEQRDMAKVKDLNESSSSSEEEEEEEEEEVA